MPRGWMVGQHGGPYLVPICPGTPYAIYRALVVPSLRCPISLKNNYLVLSS